MTVASPFIVRAETVRARTDAAAILTAAEQDASRLRATVADEREAALDEARREGLRQGLAEAAALTAQAATALETFWAERSAELRDVALAVAHRVLAGLPADETVARLAAEAVAEHARDVRLELRAAPATAAALRAALQTQPGGARVVVTSDSSLSHDACALLHPRGRSEIGLLAQFRTLMASETSAPDWHP